MLKLENVSIGYANIQVLHGISFHVNDGETVTIIGAVNGAGKSTTLKGIAGTLPKMKGSSIQFMGITFPNWKPRK